MIMGRHRGNTAPFRAFKNSFIFIRSSCNGLYPLFLDIKCTRIIRAIQSIAPTLNPATNNLPIETLAIEPYNIIPIPGGINGVIIADVAVTTEENSLEKPFFSISGTSIFASIAASAKFDPDNPPIKVDKSIFT